MADTTTVNMQEMADILRVSLPTMRALLRKYGDLPVIQAGSNGVPWQFDAEAVKSFVAQQRQAEAAAGAARDELLEQIALPLESAISAEERGKTPQDRLALARAMRAEDELAKERGFLVQTTDMRQRLTEVWTVQTQFFRSLPGTIGGRYNLPAAVVQDMQRLIDQQLRLQVQRLQDLLSPELAAAEAGTDGGPG